MPEQRHICTWHGCPRPGVRCCWPLQSCLLCCTADMVETYLGIAMQLMYFETAQTSKVIGGFTLYIRPAEARKGLQR